MLRQKCKINEHFDRTSLYYRNKIIVMQSIFITTCSTPVDKRNNSYAKYKIFYEQNNKHWNQTQN